MAADRKNRVDHEAPDSGVLAMKCSRPHFTFPVLPTVFNGGGEGQIPEHPPAYLLPGGTYARIKSGLC